MAAKHKRGEAAPKRRSLHVKKGDLVRVLAGKDKGAEGKVIAVQPERDRVVVEGVNRIKRHTRAAAQGGSGAGGIVTQEAAIHVSNVALVVEVDGEKVPTRTGHRRDEVTKNRPDGSTYTAHRSVRIAKRTGEEI
ncbi:MAG TPA: 50S ribosomal protein L24 [Nocardioidaceae bacterium]|jgi:large subunit ribosomal protein L24|nr:50S ribosomal protein L24 [Nocardioidaceae bacterium]